MQLQFVATNVPPQFSGGSPQLPVSDKQGLPVVIRSSETKETNKQDGHYLELGVEVIDGPSKGATGAIRLNLWSASAQAQQIAYKQLSAICHVVGVFNIQDTQQLHDRPFRVVVTAQQSEEGKAKGYTQVSDVLDIQGNAPGKGNPGQAQQPQQQTNYGPPAVVQVQPQPQAYAPAQQPQPQVHQTNQPWPQQPQNQPQAQLQPQPQNLPPNTAPSNGPPWNQGR